MLDESIRYDRSMAGTVAEQIGRPGHKGLVFVGLGHDWTQYRFPPEAAFGRVYKPMGHLLKEEFGDRVCQARLQCSADPSFLDTLMEPRHHHWIGFDVHDCPLARIRVSVGKGAPDVAWSRLAAGFLYLGPRARFHRNTSIAGYVNEMLFRKYRHYYEIQYGRSFQNAKEVDQYLQTHRWPDPSR